MNCIPRFKSPHLTRCHIHIVQPIANMTSNLLGNEENEVIPKLCDIDEMIELFDIGKRIQILIH